MKTIEINGREYLTENLEGFFSKREAISIVEKMTKEDDTYSYRLPTEDELYKDWKELNLPKEGFFHPRMSEDDFRYGKEGYYFVNQFTGIKGLEVNSNKVKGIYGSQNDSRVQYSVRPIRELKGQTDIQMDYDVTYKDTSLSDDYIREKIENFSFINGVLQIKKEVETLFGEKEISIVKVDTSKAITMNLNFKKKKENHSDEEFEYISLNISFPSSIFEVILPITNKQLVYQYRKTRRTANDAISLFKRIVEGDSGRVY